MTPQSTMSTTVAAEMARPMTTGNWFRDLNPLSIAVMMIGLVVVAVMIDGYLAAAVICFVFIVLSVVAGTARSFIPLFAKLFVVVGFLLFILRALLTEGATVLVPLGPIAITQEGIDDGLRFSLVVMAMCGALAFFATVTPAQKMMLALEELGVSHRVTYVVLASLQAIVDLRRNATTVLDAQRSRGIETEGNMLSRTKAFFPVLAPVFLAAITQTEERAVAMDARAFHAAGTHTRLRQLRPVRIGEILLVLAFVAACVIAVVVSRAAL